MATGQMKICFFTEGNYRGKIPKSAAGRTDMAWIAALDAEHCPIGARPNDRYDLGIIIVPKNFDGHLSDLLTLARPHCGVVATMQEGPNDYYQTKDVGYQIEYINFISDVDIIYCHNEHDQRYFRGLVPGKDIRILPTLLLEDSIRGHKFTPPHNRSGTMIGGTFCQWYSGMDSLLIAQEFGESISAPAMGRKRPEEDYVDEVTFLPYTGWPDWMQQLSSKKYAVHLMRTIAAGSFHLNCAWHGIPCIGYNLDDTQRHCFPETTVDLCDLERARKIAKNLRDNQLFYDHVSAVAIKNSRDIYGEQAFLNAFFEPFNVGK